MFNASTFVLFFIASLILVVTPGPAVLYVVARSVSQGRLAGLASVLGVGIGNYVHVIAAAVGLSAILASSALAFSAVKYLGAAYLIYLGLRKIFGSSEFVADAADAAREPLGAIMRRGVIVATLNPKTAVFFLAFLPQFVDPTRGAVWLQLLVLGSITVTLGVVSDSVYALLSSVFGDWLKRRRGFARAERYMSGAIYCGLGAMTALSGSGRTK
jgi:threonine/homoserine/homoserine lactone efflux protein